MGIMPDFQFFDIVLLAMVAAFIILRLRSVLGRRTGHEQRPPPMSPRQAPEARSEDNVIQLPDAAGRDGAAEPGVAEDSPAAAGLAKIRMADRSFDTANFLAGAGAAYEMIVKAFAEGDVATLERFLSDDVLQRFKRVIDEREANGHTHETTIVGVRSADVIEADLVGTVAEITVKFVSDLINVTRDKDGVVVAGDPTAVDEVVDIWTFSRDTTSRDPNWTLVATRVPN